MNERNNRKQLGNRYRAKDRVNEPASKIIIRSLNFLLMTVKSFINQSISLIEQQIREVVQASDGSRHSARGHFMWLIQTFCWGSNLICFKVSQGYFFAGEEKSMTKLDGSHAVADLRGGPQGPGPPLKIFLKNKKVKFDKN